MGEMVSAVQLFMGYKAGLISAYPAEAGIRIVQPIVFNAVSATN
jgi:hypothetical protein